MNHSVEVLQAIDEIYDVVNHNSAEASRKLLEKGYKVTPNVIRYQWKKNGKQLALRGGRRHGYGKKDVQILLKAYETYDRSAYLVAKKLPYSESTVIKVWKQHGLSIRKKGERIQNNSFKKGSSLVDSCIAPNREQLNKEQLDEIISTIKPLSCIGDEYFPTMSEIEEVRNLFL